MNEFKEVRQLFFIILLSRKNLSWIGTIGLQFLTHNISRPVIDYFHITYPVRLVLRQIWFCIQGDTNSSPIFESPVTSAIRKLLTSYLHTTRRKIHGIFFSSKVFLKICNIRLTRNKKVQAGFPGA